MISAISVFQRILTFSLAKMRSCRIFLERKLSRRCTTVTVLAMLERVRCFSTAGVAAADHDHVLVAIEEAVTGGGGAAWKVCSLSMPSHLALAMVAMISVSAVQTWLLSVRATKGRWLTSTW